MLFCQHRPHGYEFSILFNKGNLVTYQAFYFLILKEEPVIVGYDIKAADQVPCIFFTAVAEPQYLLHRLQGEISSCYCQIL